MKVEEQNCFLCPAGFRHPAVGPMPIAEYVYGLVLPYPGDCVAGLHVVHGGLVHHWRASPALGGALQHATESSYLGHALQVVLPRGQGPGLADVSLAPPVRSVCVVWP